MAEPSDRPQAPRDRVCFTLRVRTDRLAEYRERHAAVWPEFLRALDETGWTNYSLFLSDDGLLVGYLETEDFDAAREGMAAREVNERWQTQMAPFFEGTGGAAADQSFNLLTEVFHLEDQLAAAEQPDTAATPENGAHA